jgi:hypothetical protein
MRQKSRAGGLVVAAAPARVSVKAENAELTAGHDPTPVVAVHASASKQQTVAQPTDHTRPAHADADNVPAVQVRGPWFAGPALTHPRRQHACCEQPLSKCSPVRASPLYGDAWERVTRHWSCRHQMRHALYTYGLCCHPFRHAGT